MTWDRTLETDASFSPDLCDDILRRTRESAHDPSTDEA